MSNAIALTGVTKHSTARSPLTTCRSRCRRAQSTASSVRTDPGKTTTLRMIMHILLPDRGEIEVLGTRDTGRRARPGQLPAGRARPLQEDDDPPAAPLLRAPEGRADRRDSIASIEEWMRAAWTCPACSIVRSRRSRRACRRKSSSSPPWCRARRCILDEPFSGLDPVNAAGAEGRGARNAAARHDRRLQHARHGHRRADVRSDLHDLPRAARCSTARSRASRTQYGADTVRVRTRRRPRR